MMIFTPKSKRETITPASNWDNIRVRQALLAGLKVDEPDVQAIYCTDKSHVHMPHYHLSWKEENRVDV